MKYTSMKDIGIDIQDIADDFEMTYDYVAGLVDQLVKTDRPDKMTYEEAVPFVRGLCEKMYQTKLAIEIMQSLKKIQRG